ncbi:hypothetical protein RKE30_14140 [Streptomyces sp. Li-HN-5-11]|nr:hypothetical protein [Streptomyces sp. Li-HN-5-11]WNM31468.1 hypothetical protein RKE30_14140 [Streptomyces sp. Li-HN-5-11]
MNRPGIATAAATAVVLSLAAGTGPAAGTPRLQLATTPAPRTRGGR